MEYRLTLDSLPKQIKLRLKDYYTVTRSNTGEFQSLKASGKCAFCDRSKDRKTTKSYTNCSTFTCRDYCLDCFKVH